MAVKGYSGLSIPDETAEALDQFMARNQWMGFRSRTELILAAIREYLGRHGMEPQANTPQEETQERAEKGRGKGKH